MFEIENLSLVAFFEIFLRRDAGAFLEHPTEMLGIFKAQVVGSFRNTEAGD